MKLREGRATAKSPAEAEPPHNRPIRPVPSAPTRAQKRTADARGKESAENQTADYARGYLTNSSDFQAGMCNIPPRRIVAIALNAVGGVALRPVRNGNTIMAIELEAKMKVDDFDATRRRLRDSGARQVGSVLETNSFFDTRDRSLLSQDKGLRLRQSRDDATGKQRFVITVKGAQQEGPFKSREESEVNVEDGDDAAAVLHALGFEPTLSFQKKRESWTLGACKIELDELPILGRFVEIEGPDTDAIAKVREMLALSNLKPIQTGYIAMLSKYLKDHADQRREITFQD
jgi:adenylate cyclase, class 2